MIKIENVEIQGFEPAIRGMRNPKNSWDRSDSGYCHVLAYTEPSEERCMGCPMWTGKDDTPIENTLSDDIGVSSCGMMNNEAWKSYTTGFVIGPNDHELAMRLSSGGPVHAKYRRMIIVWADITAPLYWWKEFDTYKVGTIANSCSTMHKIHAKEFVREDFSREHLIDNWVDENVEVCTELTNPHINQFDLSVSSFLVSPMDVLDITIKALNASRDAYLKICEMIKNRVWVTDKNWPRAKLFMLRKKYWWQMIQLLPSSYNQRRTVMFSYEMLANTDIWRSDHKQDEWREFCKWARTLPYSELFTKQKQHVEIMADNVVVAKVNVDIPPVQTDEYVDSEGNHSVTNHYEVPEAGHGQKD